MPVFHTKIIETILEPVAQQVGGDLTDRRVSYVQILTVSNYSNCYLYSILYRYSFVLTPLSVFLSFFAQLCDTKAFNLGS